MLLTFCACGNKDVDNGDDTNNTINSTENNSSNNNDSNSIDSYKGTIGDSKLAGAWSCVSMDNKGDYAFGIAYSYDADLYVMYNGQCYGSLIESIYKLDDDGNWLSPACSIDAKNGEFTFTEVSYNGEETLDIKAEYTVNNIEKSSASDRDTVNVFYRDAKDDQLIIRLTGTLKMSPTDVKNIDLTLVYEKNGFTDSENEGILWAAMVGEWTDNYGNKWTFMPRTEVEDLGFTMTSNGTEYKGKSEDYVAVSVGSYEVNGKIEYLMSFYYDDENMSAIYDAKVISYNGNELCLEQKDGQTLTFKR